MSTLPTNLNNVVLIHDANAEQWLFFEKPQHIFQTNTPAEVINTLQALENAVNAQGLYAAGFLSYEAASGFDASMMTRLGCQTPLVWFGLYSKPRVIKLPEATAPCQPTRDKWQASLTPADYAQAFAQIKHRIYEGDVYQVNLTYRLRQALTLEPLDFFINLINAQKNAFGAFLSTSQWTICSASPELFFSLEGTRLISRPMKGTAARGLTCEEDQAQADTLQSSEKNRAENLMIVDMVRNDMGRIATPGSIHVPTLFAMEKYPTLWQMTSTVEAHTTATLCDIFQALFPPASITGAPKTRAMSLIAATENAPRNIYTGAIGFIGPGRRAQFNVAIRTLLIDHAHAQAEYGVGGGIVWDSTCNAEQAECLTKARVLDNFIPAFNLLETILWHPLNGYALLERHITRLSASANYFDYALNLEELKQRLAALAQTLAAIPHKVRLLLAPDGVITLEAEAFLNRDAPHALPLARQAIDRSDPFLYHKTTHRQIYRQALASTPGFDDVLLWNTSGEITESTRMNVIAEINGVLCTPPVTCGLLPGTYRAQMLANNEVTERVITIAELLNSRRVFLINSVRGMFPVSIIPPKDLPIYQTPQKPL